MLTARQIDIIERQQREKDAEILRLRQRNDVLIEQIVKLEQVPAETAMLRDANQRLRQRVERLDLLLRRSREILDDAWVDGRNEKRTDLVSDISAALAQSETVMLDQPIKLARNRWTTKTTVATTNDAAGKEQR